jgi:hypothetical protein
MSRAFPTGSTTIQKIPAYTGMPNGGDLMALYVRAYFFSVVAGRFVTRREGVTPNAWALAPAAGSTMSWNAGFSTTASSVTWPCAAKRWLDILVIYDYVTAGALPVVYQNGIIQTLTVITNSAGTPNVATEYVRLGNRDTGAAPSNGAISELAWWKGRLLNAREAKLITMYGPDAVPRSRTGWWELDKYGGPWVPNHDERSASIASVSGTGVTNFAPAPPRRRRLYPIAQLAVLAPAVTASGAKREYRRTQLLSEV